MVIQVTVGDAGSHEGRGTVTAGLASRLLVNEQRAMIELTAAADEQHCTARLTIGEAEVLYNALDSLILDAALATP